MPREHDTVALTRDLPQQGLAAGDIGVIVHVYSDGLAYEVEFVTLTGRTIAVETLPIDAVRAVRDEEIAHVRQVAAE
jgi:Domain of unknown function (DUF4926)